MTSHAAVVARGMGKPCVAGVDTLEVDARKKQARVGDTVINEGDWITITGNLGHLYLGQVPVITPEVSGDFGIFMSWVEEFRKMGVRANADTPNDARQAREFGAEGIGLCRTEHMFFEPERIKAVREMILADDVEGRKKALAKIMPMQKGDFKGIFEVMDGLPVTIRLLDPPLHEFLPHEDKHLQELALEMGVPADRLKAKVDQLHEFNPMLGHRGCRLAITYPEICEMQARAIMEAACELKKEGKNVIPEIMVPLVATVKEFKPLKDIIIRIAQDVMNETGVKVDYKIGTMIELPRAAICADEIAKEAEFFSFGTNDLTQTAFGLSRDDAGRFLPFYVEKKILPEDPFVSIDKEGVGVLMKIAIEKGKKARPDIKLGICGEHGGEPESVKFCYAIGLNYVSCSPFRVPVARLAAAHAAMQAGPSTTA
jgi:pyruvate,orthophosphate dikinase